MQTAVCCAAARATSSRAGNRPTPNTAVPTESRFSMRIKLLAPIAVVLSLISLPSQASLTTDLQTLVAGLTTLKTQLAAIFTKLNVRGRTRVAALLNR